MRRRFSIAIVTLSFATVAFAQSTPVPVFVTSVGAVGGMTDPSKDNLDTVKDLINKLKDDKREVVIVKTREEAVIVLTVHDRETAQGTAAIGAGVFTPYGSQGRDRIVRVEFAVGEMLKTEMRASAQGGTLGSGGAWKKAAGKIADQVRDWIRINHGKLPVR